MRACVRFCTVLKTASVCVRVGVCACVAHAATSVRVTKFNIATFRGFAEGEGPSDVTVRGPVEFGDDEMTAGFSFMRMVTLIVDRWPYERYVAAVARCQRTGSTCVFGCDSPDGKWVMEINGVTYVRDM